VLRNKNKIIFDWYYLDSKIPQKDKVFLEKITVLNCLKEMREKNEIL
jgi:hypothetical protein